MIAFDVCGTLYQSNTTFDFVRYLFPRFSKLLFSLPARLLNKVCVRLFGFDLIRAVAIRRLKGVSKEELYCKADDFVEKVLNGLRIEATHDLLATFDRDNVCLISASIDPVISAIAKRLQITCWYSSELSYINGFCLGGLSVDLLGRKHRLFEMERFSIMVTDNRSDLLFVLRTNMSYLIANKNTIKFWGENKREQDTIFFMKD